MQLTNADSVIAHGTVPEYFVYHGWMEVKDIPRNVTHVRIHSSARAIKENAFYERWQLMVVILNEELEEIGEMAFHECISLERILIPNAVKTIKLGAFGCCSSLTTVTLGEGLEEIGEQAFCDCQLLHSIIIPDAVKTIKMLAFGHCSGSATVTLGNGLEEIGMKAFVRCPSLHEIIYGDRRKYYVYMNDDDGDVQEYFVYYGQAFLIPRDVTHVRFHSSVKAIWDSKYIHNALFQCSQLVTVILNDGLEEIGRSEFYLCTLLQRIIIPNTVKTIKKWAFEQCSGLMSVTLGNGLQEIGDGAFSGCTSLQEIVIPNAVKAIPKYLFLHCSGLITVTLRDGIEEIRKEAFKECTSLQRIVIPPAVKDVDDSAFKNCSSLTNVAFSDEIEDFVSCEAMRDWWNGGVHERSLSTYGFFVRCNIPDRLGCVQVRSWQANIFNMLRRIPSVHPKGMNSYNHSIDSRFSVYEIFKNTPALLELALWKSKINEQYCQSDFPLTTKMKMQCRNDSVAMVNIIVPNVMSFLTDSDDSNMVVDDYGDEDYGDEDWHSEDEYLDY
jgi:hypothetical protein